MIDLVLFLVYVRFWFLCVVYVVLFLRFVLFIVVGFWCLLFGFYLLFGLLSVCLICCGGCYLLVGLLRLSWVLM